MKEFIEKLNGRLEEELKLAEIDRERYLHGNSTQFNYGKAVGYGNAVSVAIEIVNQLAEEYGKKNTYEIALEGCDDCTVFTMELTKQEYEFLVSVSELANKTSTYGCMPRMYIGAKGE